MLRLSSYEVRDVVVVLVVGAVEDAVAVAVRVEGQSVPA